MGVMDTQTYRQIDRLMDGQRDWPNIRFTMISETDRKTDTQTEDERQTDEETGLLEQSLP